MGLIEIVANPRLKDMTDMVQAIKKAKQRSR
jgi:hypothetical protein